MLTAWVNYQRLPKLLWPFMTSKARLQGNKGKVSGMLRPYCLPQYLACRKQEWVDSKPHLTWETCVSAYFCRLFQTFNVSKPFISSWFIIMYCTLLLRLNWTLAKHLEHSLIYGIYYLFQCCHQNRCIGVSWLKNPTETHTWTLCREIENASHCHRHTVWRIHRPEKLTLPATSTSVLYAPDSSSLPSSRPQAPSSPSRPAPRPLNRARNTATIVMSFILL